MTELRELIDQRRALDAQIAARKGEAVEAIKKAMVETGVTIEDLGGYSSPRAGRGRAPTPVATGQKRPVKYRDPDGNTWTGVGQRPRWLQKALAAGSELKDFAVTKD